MFMDHYDGRILFGYFWKSCSAMANIMWGSQSLLLHCFNSYALCALYYSCLYYKLSRYYFDWNIFVIEHSYWFYVYARTIQSIVCRDWLVNLLTDTLHVPVIGRCSAHDSCMNPLTLPLLFYDTNFKILCCFIVFGGCVTTAWENCQVCVYPQHNQ